MPRRRTTDERMRGLRRPRRGRQAAGGMVGLLLAFGGWPHGALADTPAAPVVASQRDWLLAQIRLGEATGSIELSADALRRLRLIAPDDPKTLAAGIRLALRQRQPQQADALLARLRARAPGSAELAESDALLALSRPAGQQALQQAHLLATAGHGSEALAAYRKLFGDPPPGLELGVEYWRLRSAVPGQRKPAIARLTALERDYPGNVPLRQLLANLLFDDGRPAEALALLRQMGADPNARELAAQREFGYLKNLPTSAAAASALQAFADRYPSSPLAGDARGQVDQMRAQLADPAWQAKRTGLDLLERQHNAEAENALRRALRGHPDDAAALGNLGLAVLRQGRREEALGYFRQAAKREQDSRYAGKWRDLAASTRFWLGLQQAGAALEAGQVAPAKALYLAARREQPRNLEATLGLANVALAEGRDEEAERQFQAALRLDPGNERAVRGLMQRYAAQDRAKATAYANTLPPAQRRAYAGLLRGWQRERLEREAENTGDAARAIGLLEAARQLAPDDAWLTYRLAGRLRAQRRVAEADAAFAALLARNGGNPEARHAHALYLASGDQDAAALASLHAIAPAHWTADMRELAARLEREQLFAHAEALRGTGREREAIALLQRQPHSVEFDLRLADWAQQRKDYRQALRRYAQVLAARPDNADARLGRIETWLDAGDLDRARQALQTQAPALPPTAINARRRLAMAWARAGDPGRARALMRELLARQSAPAALLHRDAARLLRRDDPQRALDEYALALRDNGLLAAGQAAPRDDRALTLASREHDGDDWLRRSLRDDVDTLYRQQNPTLAVADDYGWRHNGTPGLSRLRNDTGIAHLELPWQGGQAFLRAEHVRLDAGGFATGADGRYTDDFGSCRFATPDSDGAAQTLPGCTGHRRQQASGTGIAAGWRSADGNLAFDLGHSPFGFPVGNWLGGVSGGGDFGVLGYTLTASRRPMTNSLLSYAGAVDPRTGIRWGGVTANGVTLNLSYDQGGRNGVWANLGQHRLLGQNVAANDRTTAMSGWYIKLVRQDDLRLTSGVTVMAWRYARDLGNYSLGQGGYYSPQRYASVGVPLNFAWRSANWSLLAEASVSWSVARTGDSRQYPLRGLVAGPLADLAAQAAPASLDGGGFANRGGSSHGSGYLLHLAAERRLSNHLVLGGDFTLQHSRDYAPSHAQLYLRYVFEPWRGNLPLPVRPLTPYGDFR
ncbi:cellulose synthase complex outer membrane protein BcsC [Frateuria defendens]|uniref:cellulose synthase complex outer membrane protein BcsC n=1 Tax=Frateuria defendens TaxID=2219559 RepID=UPI000AE88902|nr:cellulose synthase complex outer membrane protein BcsC [Frateuria defendens]